MTLSVQRRPARIGDLRRGNTFVTGSDRAGIVVEQLADVAAVRYANGDEDWLPHRWAVWTIVARAVRA